LHQLLRAGSSVPDPTPWPEGGTGDYHLNRRQFPRIRSHFWAFNQQPDEALRGSVRVQSGFWWKPIRRLCPSRQLQSEGVIWHLLFTKTFVRYWPLLPQDLLSTNRR